MTDLDSIEATLDEAAREAGVSREEALKRAIVALAEANDVDVPDVEDVDRITRVVSEVGETTEELEATVDDVEQELETVEEDVETVAESVGDVEREVDEVTAAVDSVATDLEEIETDLEEKVEDVRERLVQLYREVEGKAADDHSHPALAGAVDDVRTAVDDVESVVDDVDDRMTTLEGRVEDLDDRIDGEVSEKLSKLAGALVRVQRRLGNLENVQARRETLADLTAAANREGISKAKCERCENPVRIALMNDPACPHCEARLGGVEPADGFFGTARLTVGDPPALEGEVAPREGEDLFEDE